MALEHFRTTEETPPPSLDTEMNPYPEGSVEAEILSFLGGRSPNSAQAYWLLGAESVSEALLPSPESSSRVSSVIFVADMRREVLGNPSYPEPSVILRVMIYGGDAQAITATAIDGNAEGTALADHLTSIFPSGAEWIREREQNSFGARVKRNLLPVGTGVAILGLLTSAAWQIMRGGPEISPGNLDSPAVSRPLVSPTGERLGVARERFLDVRTSYRAGKAQFLSISGSDLDAVSTALEARDDVTVLRAIDTLDIFASTLRESDGKAFSSSVLTPGQIDTFKRDGAKSLQRLADEHPSAEVRDRASAVVRVLDQ